MSKSHKEMWENKTEDEREEFSNMRSSVVKRLWEDGVFDNRVIRNPRDISTYARGFKQTEYQKNRMKEVHTGKIVAQSSRDKISKANKGRKYPEIECPHCGKKGSGPSMGRWHFDNCKDKK